MGKVVKALKYNKSRLYLLFEEVSLLQRERICLGNDWNNVDHLTQTSHEFYIKRPETERRDNTREADVRFMNKNTGNCNTKLSHQRADVPKNRPRTGTIIL